MKLSSDNAKLVLVTGLSGAGRSTALKTLEDCGFEAIDNLPLAFLPAVAAAEAGERLAVGIDARSRDFSAEQFARAVQPLDCRILFLDCDDEALRRRFTETRRAHPLAHDRPVTDGIAQERRMLEGVRALADVVIDTSDLPAVELKRIVSGHFGGEAEPAITVLSFSYKYGVPREADIVLDVRFLKNPHYEPALKDLTGRDAEVGNYIAADQAYPDFFENLCGWLLPLLPRYRAEGKRYLTLAIGCTGGQHRSVFVAEKLAKFLRTEGHAARLRHRELG